MILFGATGDLSHRLVLPAFFSLAQAGLLPRDWRLVGNGRGDVAHEDFRQRVRESLEEFGPRPADGPWDEFAQRLWFAGGGFDADNPGSLLDVVAKAEKELAVDGTLPQRVHYLAVPPAAFGPLTEGIGTHGLADRSRVVYEKPFGTSLTFLRGTRPACAHSVFDERTRSSGSTISSGRRRPRTSTCCASPTGCSSRAWNHEHIERVEIDVPETLDVGMRADFYEHTGAILDMIVTHLFQLAAEVAMEPPASLDPAHIAQARQDGDRLASAR